MKTIINHYKTGFLLLLFAIFSFGFNNSEFELKKAENWYNMAIKGKFKIAFPAEPIPEVDVVETETGNLYVSSFTSYEDDTEDITAMYVFNFTEYPKGYLDEKNSFAVENFLRSTLKETTEAIDGKLAFDKAVKLQKYTGREYIIYFGGGDAVITGRIFYVKDKLYVIQAVSHLDYANADKSYQFLNSFKIQ